MTVQLEPTSFWNYQQYIVEQVRHLLVMAEGGQLITRGTDIEIPSEIVSHKANTIINDWKTINTKIGQLSVSLSATLEREVKPGV